VQSAKRKEDFSLRYALCILRLTSWFFNLCYAVALTVASPWILYRFIVLKKYRGGWTARMLPKGRPNRRRIV